MKLDVIISPGKLKGFWQAPLSKSVCHRLIICNAIKGQPVDEAWLFCNDTQATFRGIKAILSGQPAEIDCGDSASTFRFLKPVAEAVGSPVKFIMSARLAERIAASGYKPSLTSQGISGMLMANLAVPGYFSNIPAPEVSAGYVEMTKAAVRGKLKPEGDWSAAANFILAAYLGAEVSISGLSENSLQPDACICEKLESLGGEVDINECPDLGPVLYAASEIKGIKTEFKGLERLKYKESDRIEAAGRLLKQLPSGKVQSYGDHRIAMLAGVLARMGLGGGAVTISGAECVGKSYPEFWRDLQLL